MARLTNIKAFWEGLDAGAAERRREEELAMKKQKQDQDFLFEQAREDRLASGELRTTEDFNLARAGKLNAQNKALYDGETFTLSTPTLRATQALDIERQNKINEFRLNNTATEFENLKKAGELGQTDIAQKLFNIENRQKAVALSPTTADGASRKLLGEQYLAGKISKQQFEEATGTSIPTALEGSPLATANFGVNSTAAITDMAKKREALAAITAKQDDAINMQVLKNDGTQAVADTRAQSAETVAAARLAAKPGAAAAATPASRAAAQQAATANTKAVLGQVVQPATVMPTAPATVAPKATSTPAPAAVAPNFANSSEIVRTLEPQAAALANELAAIEKTIPVYTPGRVNPAYAAWQNSGLAAYNQKKKQLEQLTARLAEANFIAKNQPKR